MRKLGLVCGLGIGAGIHYYRHIADAFAARGAQPGLVISHADIGRAYTLVQQGAMEELADYLNEHLETLARADPEAADKSELAHLASVSGLAPQFAPKLSFLRGQRVRARQPVEAGERGNAIGFRIAAAQPR